MLFKDIKEFETKLEVDMYQDLINRQLLESSKLIKIVNDEKTFSIKSDYKNLIAFCPDSIEDEPVKTTIYADLPSQYARYNKLSYLAVGDKAKYVKINNIKVKVIQSSKILFIREGSDIKTNYIYINDKCENMMSMFNRNNSSIKKIIKKCSSSPFLMHYLSEFPEWFKNYSILE